MSVWKVPSRLACPQERFGRYYRQYKLSELKTRVPEVLESERNGWLVSIRLGPPQSVAEELLDHTLLAALVVC